MKETNPQLRLRAFSSSERGHMIFTLLMSPYRPNRSSRSSSDKKKKSRKICLYDEVEISGKKRDIAKSMQVNETTAFARNCVMFYNTYLLWRETSCPGTDWWSWDRRCRMIPSLYNLHSGLCSSHCRRRALCPCHRYCQSRPCLGHYLVSPDG